MYSVVEPDLKSVAVTAVEIASVETAFFDRGFLPPPASFTLVLAGGGCPGAGFAADTYKALIVEWIVRQVKHPHVIPNLL